MKGDGHIRDLIGYDSGHRAKKDWNTKNIVTEGMYGRDAILKRLENPRNRRERKTFEALKRREHERLEAIKRRHGKT